METQSSRPGLLPPGPKPLPFVGNLLDFIRWGPDLFERSARSFGDITTISLGGRKHFLVNDPALIQRILVRDRQKFEKGRALGLARRALGSGLLTSDGETYREQRRAAQPAFNIRNMPWFEDSVRRSLDNLDCKWRDGFTFDLMGEMTELCIDVAARAFLGVDIAPSAHEVGRVFEEMLSALNKLNLLPPAAELAPIPLNFRIRRLKRRLGAIADGIIEERRSRAGRSTDLLSLILAQASPDGAGFTPAQMREQVITFLFAGYEAPCKALFWTWYLLGRDGGGVEQRLLAELDEVLGGRAPGLDDVPQLRYTRGVVSEAMRLYPPAWIIARKICEPYEAAGYTLPAGAEIFMSPYITQRDARFFPDPLAFHPERWLEPDEGRPQFAYFPFGGGLRGCSGAHFAWPELILIVASLAQKWRVELVGKGEIKPTPAFTFGPRRQIRAIARRRTAVSAGDPARAAGLV